MIWNAKGNEFNAAYYEWTKQNDQPVWIFGAGKTGRDFFYTLHEDVKIKGFIDNDETRHGTTFLGCPVISWEDYKSIHEKGIIVICASKSNSDSIRRKIANEQERVFGCKEYLFHHRIKLLYKNNILYMPIVQMSVTERCTLKCMKCAHACNYTSSMQNDPDIEEMKNGIICYHKLVDKTGEFYLIGGEPLLFPKLPELIRFIAGKYRNRIRILSITTNGTLIPDDNLLDACIESDVLFRVSNYVKAIPKLRQQTDRLVSLFEKKGVRYCLQSEDNVWMDYGFDHVDHGMDARVLKCIFDACDTPCRELRGKRFYYCIQARATADNMHLCIGNNDYLDLSSLTGETGKRILLEYDSGYSDRGYLEMCNHCYGANAVKHPVPAALQMQAIPPKRGC